MDIINADFPHRAELLDTWQVEHSRLYTCQKQKGLIQLTDVSCMGPAAGPVLGRSFQGRIKRELLVVSPGVMLNSF